MTQTAPDCLAQDFDMELIRILAPHVQERFFIDVGAERGSFDSAMFLCGMRGALVEPMARHREKLVRLAAHHRSNAYAYAIDATDGERDFFIASGIDGKELDHFHSLDKLEGASQFRHSRSVRVECRSLESLVREGTLPERVGVLKTDTEGHDIGVLSGLGTMRPELVVCEYFTEGLYAGWKNAQPGIAINLMPSNGYSRYLATKRVSEFEYCSASPTGFLPRQWGNLFFLDDALFLTAEAALVAFLEIAERRLISGIQAIAADRIAKEAVIQSLLAT